MDTVVYRRTRDNMMSAMERGMILANYNDAEYTIVQLLVSQLPDRLMKLESGEIIISCAYL